MGLAWKKIEDAVENEFRKLESQATVKRFGFDVPDTEEEGGSIAGSAKGLRVRTKAFAADQKAFLEALIAESLRPQAILPGKLWDGLCRKFGLYRFEHLDEAGQTGIPPESRVPAKLCIAASAVLMALFGLLGAGAICLVFACSMTLGIVDFFWAKYENQLDEAAKGLLATIGLISFALAVLVTPFAIANIIPGFLGVMLGIASCVFMFFYCYKFDTFILPLLLKKIPHDWLYKLIWPTGVDSRLDGEAEEKEKIKVEFNVKPTSGFSRVLLDIKRSKCFRPMIAATPEAISTDKNMLIGAIQTQAKRLDPILYVRQNDLVAVFDQIGEFASEKEVIDWIRKEGLRISYLESV